MFPRKYFALCVLCLSGLSAAARVRAEAAVPGETAANTPVVTKVASTVKVRPLRIVVGFMGGRVKPTNYLHKEALVAQQLHERMPDDLQVLVFANHSGDAALSRLLELVDRDGDHRISEAERKSIEIAIYGHSWGASEAIHLARSLQKQAIPVALTIQVDSIQKCGENDKEIPSNVQEAVNLYQRGGLLRGRSSIYAEDATKTRIVMNQQYHYGGKHTINITKFPWFARTFMRQHIMIENDPEVWDRVENLLETAMLTPVDVSRPQ